MFTGGSIPNWLNRDRVSGILISEMYLRNKFQVKSQDVSSLLPISLDVLDEGVGDSVPGELLASRLPEDRVVSKMGCRVDHWHRCLVSVDVVPLTEDVNDVQLDVGKGSEGVEDETSEVLHALKA